MYHEISYNLRIYKLDILSMVNNKAKGLNVTSMIIKIIITLS